MRFGDTLFFSALPGLCVQQRLLFLRDAYRILPQACVDILRSNHGPVIMEVNSSPGLEGIEGATGKDIAAQIMEYIEKNAAPGKTRTRGTG